MRELLSVDINEPSRGCGRCRLGPPYNRLVPERLQEPDEEPDEPDQPDEPAVDVGTQIPITAVAAAAAAGREFEYRSELLSLDEVSDATLVEKLNQGSADGWDLVDVIPAGDKHVLLLRRPKRSSRETRPVGFLRSG